MLEAVLYALEMFEGMRRVPLCMVEVVAGEVCLLELLEAPGRCAGAMRCVLLCLLEVSEAILCVLRCSL